MPEEAERKITMAMWVGKKRVESLALLAIILEDIKEKNNGYNK